MKISRAYLIIGVVIAVSLISVAKCEYDFYEDILNNPYRLLRIPPWSSMSKIRQRYIELIKSHHPDKTKNRNANDKFLEIQQAYERIKSIRKSNEKDEMEDYEDSDSEMGSSMFDAVSDSLKIILSCGFFLSLIYFVSWVCHKFYAMIYGPLFSLITSFVICDRVFPHYFKNLENQIIYSIVFGVLIFVIKKFSTRMFSRVFSKNVMNNSIRKTQ
jgi:curved DNA-binding protein CbpA